MNTKILCSIAAVASAMLISATNVYSFSSFGNNVNATCATATPPSQPFTGDCSLCHVEKKGDSTPAMTAYLAGGSTLKKFFCPDVIVTCTDNDGDSFAVEGADCGPVDCDDTNAKINPQAFDIANNGIDENCDGADSVDPTLLDNDGDGFTPAAGDCNDADAAINPGATENCSDTIDNNCNDLVDDQDPAAVGCLVCTDYDQDTFFVEGGDCGPVDCDDTNAAINLNAIDIANNGIDENCDGADSVDPTVMDNDGDGYTQADGDCDDTTATINPGAFDIPNNGIDENCDGVDNVDTTIIDNDGDGFTQVTGDCDDTDAAINPDALEVCTDGIDNDCNNLVDTQDPNAVDCLQSCFDNDGDTYAIEGGECGPVDCEDNDTSINPGAEEICEDGLDNDCDGSVDEGCDVTCPDADEDGYQDAACGGTDCNDNDVTINPGSAEICGNDIDENCNGASDDSCLTCLDGSLLFIKEMEYNQGDEKLEIKGGATAGTSISIINSDTGEILAKEVLAKKGKWKAKIKDVGANLNNVGIVSSNGCAVELQIVLDRKDREDKDDKKDKRDKKNKRDKKDKRKRNHH